MRKKIVFTIAMVLFLSGPACLAAEEAKIAPQAGANNKISLDIKGMDVVDVLKMLSQRMSQSIVVGKNVSGRVTLFLKDVDAWDAFEITLLANELAYDRKGDIINVMSQRDYELQYGERFQDAKKARIIKLKYMKASDALRSLTQIKTNVGKVVADEGTNTIVLIDAPEKVKEMEEFILNTDMPIETRVFALRYGVAEKLQPKLAEMVTKGAGTLKIDERTNKIVVTDYISRLEEIANVIAAFDEKTPQVLIDAQVIELTPSDEFKMGVDWNYWIEKYFQFQTKLPLATGIGGTGITLSTATSDPTKPGQYKGAIEALRTIGDTKVLSSPRIMALNNQEAKILVGTKEAYVTSTVSQGASGQTVTSPTVSFVDVGLKLYVTPTINNDGFVMMKIKPEISSATYKDVQSGGQTTTVPIVTTSEAETAIMVKDGVTIIIGGLKKDKRDKTVQKIPLLGDVPGLGHLFRNTSDSVTKTELVILLTPHIISGEKSYLDFSEIKPLDGGVVSMVGGKIVTEKYSSRKFSESYYRIIIDKIKAQAAFARTEGEKGSVTLEFVLSEDGSLKGDPEVIASTNYKLEAVAVSNIRQSAPFAPFPKDSDKKEESLNIILEYK